MKKAILSFSIAVLCLAIAFPVSAQKKKNEPPVIEAPTFKMDDDGKVVYTEVVEQAGSPAELYKRCLTWYNTFYKNPTNVIKEKNDAENIKGQARFNIHLDDAETGVKTNAGMVQYDINILFKEGRYKYEITRINKKERSYYGIENWIAENKKKYSYAYASYLTETNDYFNKLIADLKKGMQPVAKKSDDW